MSLASSLFSLVAGLRTAHRSLAVSSASLLQPLAAPLPGQHTNKLVEGSDGGGVREGCVRALCSITLYVENQNYIRTGTEVGDRLSPPFLACAPPIPTSLVQRWMMPGRGLLRQLDIAAAPLSAARLCRLCLCAEMMWVCALSTIPSPLLAASLLLPCSINKQRFSPRVAPAPLPLSHKKNTQRWLTLGTRSQHPVDSSIVTTATATLSPTCAPPPPPPLPLLFSTVCFC